MQNLQSNIPKYLKDIYIFGEDLYDLLIELGRATTLCEAESAVNNAFENKLFLDKL